jgi:hypothetical protein
MNQEQWTIERELCSLTGTSDVRDALIALKMLKSPTDDFQLRSQESWERGGAETYVFRFWVKDPANIEAGYIIKVCVTLDLARGIEGTLSKWIERRNLLAGCGVSVPKLFYSGRGQIIEELIPWHLRDRLSLGNEQVQDMFTSLAEYAGHLSRHGFFPIGAFEDLRSRGSDVVAVDFGSDLGSPGATTGGSSRIFEAMLAIIRKWRISLDPSMISDLRAHFDKVSAMPL